MKTISAGLLLSLVVSAGSALAADPEVGRSMAESVCASCHGIKGISSGPGFPNLAGQKEDYLRTALSAYRDGSRKAPVMNGMAAHLTDREIAHLAAHFARLKAGE